MTQELSSLMDGELEADEARRAIRGCCGNEALKEKWQAYHLIGEAMRGEGPCRGLATRRIMDALEREPTVLAPRLRLGASAGRVAFAAAASVATVAVVGWIGIQDRGTSAGPSLASTDASVPATKSAAAPNVVPLQTMNEYVAFHRQMPNADYYRPVAHQAVGGR
jgi:sigma-E factor negative regulatory protein RseA